MDNHLSNHVCCYLQLLSRSSIRSTSLIVDFKIQLDDRDLRLSCDWLTKGISRCQEYNAKMLFTLTCNKYLPFYSDWLQNHPDWLKTLRRAILTINTGQKHFQCLCFPEKCPKTAKPIFWELKIKIKFLQIFFGDCIRIEKLTSNPPQFWFPDPVCLLGNNQICGREIGYFMSKYCRNPHNTFSNYKRNKSCVYAQACPIFNFNEINIKFRISFWMELAKNSLFWMHCTVFRALFWLLRLSSLFQISRRRRNYKGN